MFGRESIGKSTEGNQGKTKGWQMKLWQVDRQSPNLPQSLSAKVFAVWYYYTV